MTPRRIDPEHLAHLASQMSLSTFIRSATAGPWYCECGPHGDTQGGYGSCSRCGRKSREQIALDAAMLERLRNQRTPDPRPKTRNTKRGSAKTPT